MTTTTAEVETHAGSHDGHHHELPWIRKYLFSTDHKTIAKQFMFTAKSMNCLTSKRAHYFAFRFSTIKRTSLARLS